MHKVINLTTYVPTLRGTYRYQYIFKYSYVHNLVKLSLTGAFIIINSLNSTFNFIFLLFLDCETILF